VISSNFERAENRDSTHLLVDGFSGPLRGRNESSEFLVVRVRIFVVLFLTRERIGIFSSMTTASEQFVSLTSRVEVETEDILELHVRDVKSQPR
jgi:hypothetical protein